LVFVVTRDAVTREFWERQLIARQFAVVPCDGVRSALEALRALRPDVVVTDVQEADQLRHRRLLGRHGRRTPIVEFAGTTDWIAVILRDIRRELRVVDLVS
jgi:CheY-like chemotaxis protein